MQVLVVDDPGHNKSLLRTYIKENGCSVAEAISDTEVSCILHDAWVDIVFIDMDKSPVKGCEICRSIKQATETWFVPVVAVTQNLRGDNITNSIDAGCDDFIYKPINEMVIRSKLRVYQKSISAFRKMYAVSRSLVYHHQNMRNDRHIIERIFDNVIQRIDSEYKNIQYYVSPQSMAKGNLLLIARSPSGSVYILLGDFTGHGLCSAVGCLPVADIFVSMASKQSEVGDIAAAINSRLLNLLPKNMFFCAVLVEVNTLGDRLSFWVGGINDILLTDSRGKIERAIPSSHLPLGVLNEEKFSSHTEIVHPVPGQKLYLFTNGVIEAENSQREFFGERRLHQILEKGREGVISDILSSMTTFQGKSPNEDIDASMVEVICQPMLELPKARTASADQLNHEVDARTLPWQMEVVLTPDILRQSDVVDQIVCLINGVKGSESHKDLIFTLVTELFSNALEHGILKLTSEDKNTSAGFVEYYQKREKRLQALKEGYIQIAIRVEKQKNLLYLQLTDTGDGFDTEKMLVNKQPTEMDEDRFYGRGISLVKSLCESIEYTNGGRTVTVAYPLG